MKGKTQKPEKMTKLSFQGSAEQLEEIYSKKTSLSPRVQEIERVLVQILDNKPLNNVEEVRKEIIDQIQDFLYKYYYPLILNNDLHRELDQRKLINTINQASNRLQKFLQYPWAIGKVKIAFAGKFSSGKSSIINSLLGEENLLPVDISPTTAFPTFLTHVPAKDNTSLFAIKKNGKVVSLNLQFLDAIKHCHTDSPYIKIMQEVIECLLLTINIGREPVIIIDTPGYNSAESLDRELSFQILKDCDVISWVIDIEDGDISRDALEIIKSLDESELYIIINKVDKKPPSRRELIKDKVEKTLADSAVKFNEVMFFSSKEKGPYSQDLDQWLQRIIEKRRADLHVKDLSIFSIIKESLNQIINTLHSKQKETINNINNIDNFENKKLPWTINEIKNIINYEFDQNFKREEPSLGAVLFKVLAMDLSIGAPQFKISPKDVDKFKTNLSNRINSLLRDSVATIREAVIKKTNLTYKSKCLDKLLNLARDARQKLDKLEDEFLEKVRILTLGGNQK